MCHCLHALCPDPGAQLRQLQAQPPLRSPSLPGGLIAKTKELINEAINERDPRDVFAGNASLISRGLEGLVLITLVAGAIPLAVAQPIWWLRIKAGSLADHKQQLAQAIEANGEAFNANISAERSAMLTNSIPGTVRIVLGALIVSAILFTITRQI